ncbi:MAG: hypothetical protein ACO1OT_06280 [Heyndrickxia sp.]
MKIFCKIKDSYMLLGIIAIICLNFIVLIRLATAYVGKGSDHYFYEYYIDAIRKNRHRLFSTFPNFVNKTYITDPQFFFWLLSYFSNKSTRRISLLLNPMLITVLVIILSFFLRKELDWRYEDIFIVILATMLTPHFFYGQNARIYGLNSRGLGLVLTFLFLLAGYYIKYTEHIYMGYAIALVSAYLIWGTSLFAQQALIFYSVVGSIFFGWYFFIIITVFSALGFYLLHPKYAKYYFINRWKYLHIYSTVFAERFLLKARFSLWRDFYYDFWRVKGSLKKHLLYIYNNGIFALIFLNPAIAIIFYLAWSNKINYNSSIEVYSFKVIIGGLFICFLTSFRFSRVLGEPERYVEIVIPFISIAAVPIVLATYGYMGIIVLLTYYVCLNVFQVGVFTHFLKNVSDGNRKMVSEVTHFINIQDKKETVSFFCNNLNLTNHFLNTNWNFISYYPTSYFLAEIAVADLIKEYPYIRINHISAIQSYYKPLYILIDSRNARQELIQLENMKVVFQKEGYMLYKLEGQV